MTRPLTDFEREHGYMPCPYFLGEKRCGVDVARLRREGKMTVCAGTVEECLEFGGCFGGQPIPGHPLAAALIASLPTVQIKIEGES